MTMRLAATIATLTAGAQADSPVNKVLSMLSELQADVIKEGEVAQKEYAEFAEWCEDRARNVGFEIKTGKSEAESLTASIADEVATIEALTTKSEDLTATIATREADLKAATEIRKKEFEDFAAEEKDLTETLNMMHRAIAILEREMQGGAGSLLQANVGNLAAAFAAMVQASAISSSDASRLTAFVQANQKAKDTDEDEEPGAPAATVYDSHSGAIVDTLQGLTEQADAQLDSARNTEIANKNNFQQLEQSLKDELKFTTADLNAAKAGIAATSERKATATGDLQATSKDLASDKQAKVGLHHDCMTKASSFEAETRSRGEELKALAEAKNDLKESTGAAASFLQLGTSSTANQVVRLVRDLARKEGSSALAQLAIRIGSAMRSPDPFFKVKGLISEMIAQLESDAAADAAHKAYCDKQLSETNAKKSDKTNEIKKLTTRIDRMTAQSAQLKMEVASLQSALANLAFSQAQSDKLRQAEHATFTASKAEIEKALKGTKLALKVLSEYYAKDGAHEQAQGAASGIIGLLEVCEADFSKNLALVVSDEEAAVSEYEQVTKANEIERANKVTDLKFKFKEAKHLDKFAKELTADRMGVQAELDAVLEYLSKIENECIAKAETYAVRKERMDSEIAGLKTGLKVLESESSFLQKQTSRHALRGHTA